MRTKGVLLLLSVFITRLTFCQVDSLVHNYSVGETNITVHSKQFHPKKSKVTFINLHDNEQTSVKAAETYLAACGGGTLVNISNQQERFIDIYLYGKCYRFDPNRIYSEEGRISTLTKLSPEVNDTVHAAVEYLAGQILQCHIDSSKLIVAIHNNTDSLLSVLSYQQDQAGKRHFGDVFVNPEMDPDDFVLTTDYSIFKKIKNRNINAVWENSRLIDDDGSLSVYAGLRKIPYINIEAEHEHIDEQLTMLNALDDIIKEYGKKKTVKKSTKGANSALTRPTKILKK